MIGDDEQVVFIGRKNSQKVDEMVRDLLVVYLLLGRVKIEEGVVFQVELIGYSGRGEGQVIRGGRRVDGMGRG